MTLSDEEAKRRGVQKSILERAAPATFDCIIEMRERTRRADLVDRAARCYVLPFQSRALEPVAL